MKYLYLLIWVGVVFMHFDIYGQHFFSAHHPNIHYVGRIDRSSADDVRFDWPGVSVQGQFTGNSAAILINGGKNNFFNLFINGDLHSVFHAPHDTTLFISGLQSVGPHDWMLTKRTESGMGIAIFRGLLLEADAIMLPPKVLLKRRIEFIGNSITCGYGTEGAHRDEPFKPEAENNFKSYGAILARAFSAEAHYIAHSGLGVVRNYGDEMPVSIIKTPMPGRFNRILDNEERGEWDFDRWRPDCVVVNLGTNDFSTRPHPDKEVFIEAYEMLIMDIRQAYGIIPVFCIVGPMIDEPCFSYVKELTVRFRNHYMDKQVYFIGFPDGLLNQEDDLGSSWHPSYRGHLKMAAQLMLPIATVLNWDYLVEEVSLNLKSEKCK